MITLYSEVVLMLNLTTFICKELQVRFCDNAHNSINLSLLSETLGLMIDKFVKRTFNPIWGPGVELSRYVSNRPTVSSVLRYDAFLC